MDSAIQVAPDCHSASAERVDWSSVLVAKVNKCGAFSRVVAYNRQTSVLRGTADTLLDAASFGSRWARALRPRAPGPEV